MRTFGKNWRWLLGATILAVAATAVSLRWFGSTKRAAGSEPAAALEPLDVPPLRETSSLRPAIRQILYPSTPPRQRIDLVMDCDPDLTGKELEAFLAEVATPMNAGEDVGWHSQYLHEICRQLQSHDPVRPRFARVLAGVALAGDRPRVERDYAIQHLRQVWHRAADDPDLRRSILESFRSLAEAGPEVAGAGMLSLHFVGCDPKKPWNSTSAALANSEIEPLIASVLKSDPITTDAGVLMAALRVAGDRRFAESATRVEEIAADISAPAVVRMAAVSVIARSGGDSAAVLQAIDRTDPRVDQAVRFVLNKSR